VHSHPETRDAFRDHAAASVLFAATAQAEMAAPTPAPAASST